MGKYIERNQPPAHWPIVDKCKGCGNTTGVICRIYTHPDGKWNTGNCPMATHIKKVEEMKTKMLNPLKASKRGMKGK